MPTELRFPTVTTLPFECATISKWKILFSNRKVLFDLWGKHWRRSHIKLEIYVWCRRGSVRKSLPMRLSQWDFRDKFSCGKFIQLKFLVIIFHHLHPLTPANNYPRIYDGKNLIYHLHSLTLVMFLQYEWMNERTCMADVLVFVCGCRSVLLNHQIFI